MLWCTEAEAEAEIAASVIEHPVHVMVEREERIFVERSSASSVPRNKVCQGHCHTSIENADATASA